MTTLGETPGEVDQELIDKVNDFMQKTLREKDLEWIGYKKGGKWLEDAGILPDDLPMQGKRFRDLLKTNKIKGWVKFNGKSIDWVVYRTDVDTAATKRMHR